MTDRVPAAVDFIENVLVDQISLVGALDLDKLVLNGFSVGFLAAEVGGAITAESIARALVLPRALGSSVSTVLGTRVRQLCEIVEPSARLRGSALQEIEFVDKVDGRKRIGRFFGGPKNANTGRSVPVGKELAALHAAHGGAKKRITACITHGEQRDLHPSFLAAQIPYEVLVGADFWHRLSGDATFYKRATAGVAARMNDGRAHRTLEAVLKAVSSQIGKRPDLMRLTK